ncbi:2-methylcitrate dehydratase PrpD [Rhizobium sp. SLBN-94]|nr:2-methylcitrate dehydratase PrpD [Rhizobium sp. SLBN-94]
MTDGEITQTLAGFVSRVRYEDLPEEVVNETKRILLDILGCAIGSVDLEKARIALEFALDQSGRPESTILGTGEKVSVALAAFSNGELMHTADHCPILPPAHITPFVTSGPLALAEARRMSGKSLITAVAVAHEVASRIGLSLDAMRVATRDHIAPTWGLSFDQFGAAAGCAKILNLGPNSMMDALGLAGYLAPLPSHNKFLGTPAGGGMAKYGPAGWTAQGGVTAAVLASKGYRGDRSVLDGERGFWAMVGSKRFAADEIVSGLGERWNVMRVMYKRWPCAGNLQAPLAAFTSLVSQHDIPPDAIERIDIKNDAMALLPRFMYRELNHNVDTQTNLAYNIAVAAHRVPVSTAWQSSRFRNDPAIRTLMQKVSIEAYPKAEEIRHRELVVEGRSYVERRPCLVEVTAGGRLFCEEAEYAHWLSVDNPQYRATDDDLAKKFRANAGQTLHCEKVESALSTIMNLEALDDVSELFTTLSPF